jgi:hypothetical protein
MTRDDKEPVEFIVALAFYPFRTPDHQQLLKRVCTREVDGSRWVSPSSKRLLGQLPGRGWVRLPCTSATTF